MIQQMPFQKPASIAVNNTFNGPANDVPSLTGLPSTSSIALSKKRTFSSSSNTSETSTDSDSLARQTIWASVWKQAADVYEEDEEEDCDPSDDDSSINSFIDDEAETATARALVRAAFSKTLSTPDLARLVMTVTSAPTATVKGGPTSTTKKLSDDEAQKIVTTAFAQQSKRQKQNSSMIYSESAPCLFKVSQHAKESIAKTSMPVVSKPDELLRKSLQNAGKTVQTVNSKGHAYFVPLDSRSTSTYTLDMVQAVRTGDLETVQKLIKSARQETDSSQGFDCRNKFGESILHIACRQGHAHILEYLLRNCQMSPKVVCDYGRTILHDACWTTQPNFDVIRQVLECAPELLHFRDSRGFTALTYIPANQWVAWNHFLRQQDPLKLVGQNLISN